MRMLFYLFIFFVPDRLICEKTHIFSPKCVSICFSYPHVVANGGYFCRP